MAIRDRWNRMLNQPASSRATTSTTYASPSASPVSSPESAPSSPGVWGTLSGFNWSSRNTTASSNSSASSSDQPHHHQQRQQQPSQSPRPKVTFTLPLRPSLKSTKKRRSKTHPSERPLTEENLAYQEVFANYTITFGSSSSSRCSFGGEISPCSSRRGSLDMRQPV